MTVINVTHGEQYIGLSTETKPVTCNEGSTYHSIDTGEEWIFYDGMWELDLRKINAIKMAVT